MDSDYISLQGLAGELVNVLKEARQNVPADLLKFGTHVKKKVLISLFPLLLFAPALGVHAYLLILFVLVTNIIL